MSQESRATAVATRDAPPEVSPFSGNGEAFNTAQRIARALSQSSIVPKQYQGNLPNVLVAMEYANRLGASVLAVCQNLDIIHGRPALRATFLIATVNASGRFTPLRFRFQGEEGTDDWGCRAVAKDRESGEECVGSLITIGLAKAEGWYGKSGSKWKTIPEQMLMYRASSFWTRVYCPELSMGMHTADEVEDSGMGAPVSAQADELGDALRETVQRAQVVEADVEEDDEPNPAVSELAALVDKARAAGAMDLQLEAVAEDAMESGAKKDVTEAKKKVSAALVKAEKDKEAGDE